MIQAMNALAPTRVMVVDDDAGYARLLVDCFSGLGFEVLYVESGAIALAEVARFHPEIILLDIRMPEMDGFEVCQIHSHEFSVRQYHHHHVDLCG